MFFIYDSVKRGATIARIIHAIADYYEAIGKKTYMSQDTLRKYRNIATDYIEGERYYELLTGVKGYRPHP